jgi:hypothetical protein
MSGQTLLVMIPGRGTTLASVCCIRRAYPPSDRLFRYIRKFEKYTPDPRFPDVDPLLHGADGPVEIGYHSHIWPGCKAFVEASMNFGIPFSPDFCTTKGTQGTNKVRLS